jgi:hypothetical protein
LFLLLFFFLVPHAHQRISVSLSSSSSCSSSSSTQRTRNNAKQKLKRKKRKEKKLQISSLSSSLYFSTELGASSLLFVHDTQGNLVCSSIPSSPSSSLQIKNITPLTEAELQHASSSFSSSSSYLCKWTSSTQQIRCLPVYERPILLQGNTVGMKCIIPLTFSELKEGAKDGQEKEKKKETREIEEEKKKGNQKIGALSILERKEEEFFLHLLCNKSHVEFTLHSTPWNPKLWNLPKEHDGTLIPSSFSLQLVSSSLFPSLHFLPFFFHMEGSSSSSTSFLSHFFLLFSCSHFTSTHRLFHCRTSSYFS